MHSMRRRRDNDNEHSDRNPNHTYAGGYAA
jgi:hypothetical protein